MPADEIGPPTDTRPNPGSTEARVAGCVCPDNDNGRGHQASTTGRYWYTTVRCPIHGGGE